MDAMLKTLVELVKIPSVSGDEKNIRKVLDYAKGYFKGKKVFVKEFKYGAASPVLFIANTKDPRLDVMALGHLDVVPAKPSQFEPYIKDNKLYGRGSYDMKCGIAADFAAIDFVLEHRKDLKFGILITTDEETASAGIKGFAAEGKISADVILDNDGGDLYTLVEKYKHPVTVRLKAAGQGGHASRPWANVNAVTRLIDALRALEKAFPRYSKEGKKPRNEWVDTLEITGITSPVTGNVTPAEAEATLNIRLTEKTPLEKLEKILGKASAKTSCSFEYINHSCGCYMDARHPVIRNYLEVAEEVLGGRVKVSTGNGATDSRLLADRSTVIVHGLQGANIHADDEYLEIESLYKYVEVVKEYLKGYKKA